MQISLLDLKHIMRKYVRDNNLSHREFALEVSKGKTFKEDRETTISQPCISSIMNSDARPISRIRDLLVEFFAEKGLLKNLGTAKEVLAPAPVEQEASHSPADINALRGMGITPYKSGDATMDGVQNDWSKVSVISAIHGIPSVSQEVKQLILFKLYPDCFRNFKKD